MKTKVVHMLNSMGMGGIENFVMNAYRNIDRKKYQFDFILQTQEKSFFEDEIEKLGGKIYKIPRFEKNPIGRIVQLKKILKENTYNVFHRHTANSVAFIDLLIAKQCKIKIRIVHSHNTSHKSTFLNNMFRTLLYMNATEHLACGIEAGAWLYGKRGYTVLYNGLDINKYEFQENIRKKYREEFKIKQDEVLLGNIGRFNEQKNHKYLLKVFSKLCETKSGYKLLLCGDGTLRTDIEKQIKNLKLDKNVILAGVRKDVNNILQAMDIFLFPSLYEGLPVTLMEGQITNIPIIMSNTITDEAIYNDNIIKLGIEENDLDEWNKAVINCKIETNTQRKNENAKLIDDYKIENVVKKLCNIYDK